MRTISLLVRKHLSVFSLGDVLPGDCCRADCQIIIVAPKRVGRDQYKGITVGLEYMYEGPSLRAVLGGM